MSNFAFAVARLIVLLFFLLIVTKLLEFFALVHGSPIRPFQVYAALIVAGGAVVLLHLRSTGFQRIHIPKAEIVIFSILALLVTVMFSSLGGHQEQGLRAALWPAANLLMGAALFYFARFMNLGPTIIGAATITLMLQLAGIILDLWIPGLFAEWAARPAGPPQNSNNGALLVALLTAMLLPIRRCAQPAPILFNIFLAGFSLVFLTLSKSGLILYFVVFAIYLVSLFATRDITPAKKHTRFLAFYIPFFLATVAMAPSLRVPDAISIWRTRIGTSIPDIAPNVSLPFGGTLPALISAGAVKVKSLGEKYLPERNDSYISNEPQDKLDASIKASDDTTSRRLHLAERFWSEALDRPFVGYGTGYIYSFKEGPHNAFVALFVEQGAAAVVLHLALLLALTLVAVRRRAVSLFAVASVGWVNSLFSHTLFIEPWFIVLACAALGISRPSPDEMLAGAFFKLAPSPQKLSADFTLEK